MTEEEIKSAVCVPDWEESSYFRDDHNAAEEWVDRAAQADPQWTRQETIDNAKGECYRYKHADVEQIAAKIALDLVPIFMMRIEEAVQESELAQPDDLVIDSDGPLGMTLHHLIVAIIENERRGAVDLGDKIDLSDLIGAKYDSAVEDGEIEAVETEAT